MLGQQFQFLLTPIIIQYLVNDVDRILKLSQIKLFQQHLHHWGIIQHVLVMKAAVTILGIKLHITQRLMKQRELIKLP